ncbi:MAG: DNA repair protein RadC [Oscillospiraceae bacterium]|nr:DNA repair protein RadC [Oscillospiraceae bacterium]
MAQKKGYEAETIEQDSPTDAKKSSEKKKNPHAGHRKRLREDYNRDGLDSFNDHKVLELLLFYGHARKDTNEVAHALMNRFGSLSDVFDADFDELCSVSGVGDVSATLITLVRDLFRRYEIDKQNKESITLNNAELVARYASKYFKGVNEEHMYLICLDSNCRLLRCDMIGKGTVNFAPVSNRKIVELAYKSNAASVILIHNHPSGITAPSRKDIDTTIGIVEAMKAIGITVSDHIIIGNGDDYFSFCANSKFRNFFRR